MKLRNEIQSVLDNLLASSEPGSDVSTDKIGDALGTSLVALDEVEAIVTGLEDAGRRVVGVVGGEPRHDLRRVVEAAHELRAAGQTVSIKSISERTGLPEARVRVAVRLGQVMGR